MSGVTFHFLKQAKNRIPYFGKCKLGMYKSETYE